MQEEEEATAPRTSATGTTRGGRSGARSTLVARGRTSQRGESASTASGVAASADPEPEGGVRAEGLEDSDGPIGGRRAGGTNSLSRM